MSANILTLANITSYSCSGKSLKLLHPDTFNNTLELNITIYQLLLSNNSITTLHSNQFTVLINLQLLSLQFNSLTMILKETFRYNTKLLTINIGYNHITIFNADLSHLPDLITLNIESNKLTTLNEYVFKSFISGNESRKRFLSVHNNNLNCNCSMHWLLVMGDTMQASISHDIACAYTVQDMTQYNASNTIPLSCFTDYIILEISACEQINITYCLRGL